MDDIDAHNADLRQGGEGGDKDDEQIIDDLFRKGSDDDFIQNADVSDIQKMLNKSSGSELEGFDPIEDH